MLLNIRKFFDFGDLERQQWDGLEKKKKTLSWILLFCLSYQTLWELGKWNFCFVFHLKCWKWSYILYEWVVHRYAWNCHSAREKIADYVWSISSSTEKRNNAWNVSWNIFVVIWSLSISFTPNFHNSLLHSCSTTLGKITLSLINKFLLGLKELFFRALILSKLSLYLITFISGHNL